MVDLIGLNIAHHRRTKIKTYPSTILGILLMIVSSLILYSFIRSATADAASPTDYSALSKWKSVDTGTTVISVAFSPDDLMVAGGLDGKIEIYSDKLELIKELVASDNKKPSTDVSPLNVPPTEHRWIMALAFSADSKLIAAACYDGTVRIWDVKTGVETICKDPKLAYDEWTARSHKGPVRSIAFSPDGSKIVSGGDDKAVKEWDVKSGKLLWNGEEHVFPVIAVAFSTDGDSISSLGAKASSRHQGESKDQSGRDGTGEFKIRNSDTGTVQNSVAVSGFSPYGAAISPDGKVAVGDSSSKVNVWDFKTGVAAYSSPWRGRGIVTHFSPDNAFVVLGQLTTDFMLTKGRAVSTLITILSVQGGQPMIHNFSFPLAVVRDQPLVRYQPFIVIPSTIYALAMSKDHRSLLFGCKDGTIQIWRVP